MALKIYTKTGDDGTTSLIGGTKVPKSHFRIEAYGTVDELNSYVGLCRDLLTDATSVQLLAEIQDRLFTIGSSLACDAEKEPGMALPDLVEDDIRLLEKEIDRMTELLPEMKYFILPGGAAVVSHLHVLRCICRRAERCCVRMQYEGLSVNERVVKYLNRLSDYIFVLARYTGQQLGVKDNCWRPRLS
jgi:cob(I)alamin adenosyltransferase